jgi:deoxyribonuclease-1
MNHFLKSLLVFVLLTSTAFAEEIPSYYGSTFATEYKAENLHDKDLLNTLFKIISNGHKTVGYEPAKDIMFGKIDLLKLPTGEFAVKDVYCERLFTDVDFPTHSIGPMAAPITGHILNTEHTWPQSKFTSRFPKETQKSDLHHLYPTDSEMNNRRASYEFGDVAVPKKILKCPIGKLGQKAQGGGEPVFEVPVNHRGNAARAIFYFATRYQLRISPEQEKALRHWNIEDPIDQAERDRNTAIQLEQGNRNPFVDMPSLVDHISSFDVK